MEKHDLDFHIAHLKNQASNGIIPKEANICTYCKDARALLKGKYRFKKGSGGVGRTLPRTNHKAQKTGLAALMAHPMAMKLHYEECLANGWYEQLPAGMQK